MQTDTPRTPWADLEAQLLNLHADWSPVIAAAKALGLDAADCGMIAMKLRGERIRALAFGDPWTANATWVNAAGVMPAP